MKTPLGTGPSMARFSSFDGNFQTLYAAASLATAIAETIVRDRFEGGGARQLFSSELEKHCVAQLSATVPFYLVDLRTMAAFSLACRPTSPRPKVGTNPASSRSTYTIAQRSTASSIVRG